MNHPIIQIGIVGLGVVGRAIHHGFTKLGHQISVHDIQQQTSINDILSTQIVYLCVPTPLAPDGSCDTKVVQSVVGELVAQDYKGIIAIKSTVEPGTTAAMQKKYPEHRFAHVPEFLRERVAIGDFTDNHDVCIIGTDSPEDYALLKASHGYFPKQFCHLTPTEAEIAKYFSNVYNAMLITFANNFYALCEKLGADYDSIKKSMVLRDNIYDKYLDCNPNLRGFGGACLPKDTSALKKYCEKLKLDMRLFDAILKDNAKYETHVHENMRP